MDHAISFNGEASDEFRSHKATLYSILEVEQVNSNSSFLMQIKDRVDELTIQTWQDIVRSRMPKQITSRDSLAFSQGFWTPPHISVLSRVEAIQNTTHVVMRLGKLSRQAEAHITRQGRHQPLNAVDGTKVFIGHGHSQIWRELKDFIEDRLGLPVDEFDGVPSAGVSISDRLSKMLDDAAFAFLILTGEDEQPGGQRRARMNVIHEAGLFQGRLGFERAIVLLEEGCEGFSNINGLVHIPFPKSCINSTFEEIRRVLEREGILSNGS